MVKGQRRWRIERADTPISYRFGTETYAQSLLRVLLDDDMPGTPKDGICVKLPVDLSRDDLWEIYQELRKHKPAPFNRKASNQAWIDLTDEIFQNAIKYGPEKAKRLYLRRVDENNRGVWAGMSPEEAVKLRGLAQSAKNHPPDHETRSNKVPDSAKRWIYRQYKALQKMPLSKLQAWERFPKLCQDYRSIAEKRRWPTDLTDDAIRFYATHELKK